MSTAEVSAEVSLSRPVAVSTGRWLDVMMRACTQRRIAGLKAFTIDVDQVRMRFELCDAAGQLTPDGLQTFGRDITSVLTELQPMPQCGVASPPPAATCGAPLCN